MGTETASKKLAFPSKFFALAKGSSTARTLLERFADTTNVRDFGAVGDGVTDDTAAVQAAIDASGGRIDFGGTGTFRITAPLGLPANSLYAKSFLVIKGSGATVLVDSADAIFTSAQSLASPDSTDDLYTGKILVTGLNFIGGSGASVVFDGDHLYSLFVDNCCFSHLTKVVYSHKAKGSVYPNGYIQSLKITSCFFDNVQKIVDAYCAFNVIFTNNFCEACSAGIYIFGAGAPAVAVLRVTDNLWEAGGVFLKLGGTHGGVISGNYFEQNTLGDIDTLKSLIYFSKYTSSATSGYPSGIVICNNSFQDAPSQRTDSEWVDIRVVHSAETTARRPTIFGNWSNGYALFNSGAATVAWANGGNGGDLQLANTGVVRLPHQYAGVGFSSAMQTFTNADHLANGVHTIAKFSTKKFKELIGYGNGGFGGAFEMVIRLQSYTRNGGVVVGSALAKVLVNLQGAVGVSTTGTKDTIYANASLIGFTQITSGTFYETSSVSVSFKPHWTNPVLTIEASGDDDYILKLSGYTPQAIPNFGAADRIVSSIVITTGPCANIILIGDIT